MLFNSYVFIFLFLPITLLGFHLIGVRGHHKIAVSWLVGASIVFYAWWNPAYVSLIIMSILFNYGIGVSLQDRPRKIILIFGIIANLSLLGYFKYANFFVENLNILVRGDFVFESVILPLAISFFTFQQVTYLVDTYRGETRELNFLHYSLFVIFFPQLIAGPIVHHKEMMPQFLKDTLYKLRVKNLTIGLTIFFIGLFKKVVLADGIANNANSVFEAAEIGVQLTFFEAWGGVLAYSLQLYFDFSGYSDMAIGLARMFGVILPINFFSPYKSTNIIEFWNRWHITLSRFLRDYLYIPLGGSRRGLPRRYINLMITMLLGGLWHGAGWTFIVWGGLHGSYLIINHGWHWLKKQFFKTGEGNGFTIGSVMGWFITFLCVAIAWVVFRAETMDGAIRVYEGMFMLNGISIPQSLVGVERIILDILPEFPIVAGGLGSFGSASGMIEIIILLFIVWKLPNTLEWLHDFNPALGMDKYSSCCKNKLNIYWKVSKLDSLLIAMFAYLSLIYMGFGSVNEFLYFNF
jgi:alginate O-acetyltransferase complex protein AlgI